MKKASFAAIVLSVAFILQVFTYATGTQKNIFIFEKGEIPEIYLSNQSSPIYLSIPASNPAHAEIVKALSETKAVALSKYDPDSGVDTGFFIISKNGKKNINLRPGGIIEVDGVPFGTTAKQYSRLVDLGNDDYTGLKPIAQWCAFMSYRNIVKVEYSLSPESKPLEIPAENVRIAAKELHELEGKSGKIIFPNSIDLEGWKNRVKMVYTFENGVQYIVYANNSFLFIESKGMTYTCQYSGDYSEYVKRAKELALKPVKGETKPSESSKKKEPAKSK